MYDVNVPTSDLNILLMTKGLKSIWELPTFPEHLSSRPVFSWVRVTRSFVYMYVLLIAVCPFVLFLLTIVLSVLLRYTDSD